MTSEPFENLLDADQREFVATIDNIVRRGIVQVIKVQTSGGHPTKYAALKYGKYRLAVGAGSKADLEKEGVAGLRLLEPTVSKEEAEKPKDHADALRQLAKYEVEREDKFYHQKIRRETATQLLAGMLGNPNYDYSNQKDGDSFYVDKAIFFADLLLAKLKS